MKKWNRALTYIQMDRDKEPRSKLMWITWDTLMSDIGAFYLLWDRLQITPEIAIFKLHGDPNNYEHN